jgi:hypothetical protein
MFLDQLAKDVNSKTFRTTAAQVARDATAILKRYDRFPAREGAFKFDGVRKDVDVVSERRLEEWFCRHLRKTHPELAMAGVPLGPIAHVVGSEIPLGNGERGSKKSDWSIDLLAVDHGDPGRPVIVEAKAVKREERSKNPILVKTLLQAMDYATRLDKIWRGCDRFHLELDNGRTSRNWLAPELVLILPRGAATVALEYESPFAEVQDLLKAACDPGRFNCYRVSVLSVPELEVVRKQPEILLEPGAVAFHSLYGPTAS